MASGLGPVRAARCRSVPRALTSLAGAISAEDMRGMNNAADAGKEDPAAIAKRFVEARFGK